MEDADARRGRQERKMNKTIEPQLVRHIAKLSRIELSEEQVATFGRQLASILEYFDKLKELDTTGVEPLAHAVEIHNVLAEDKPQPSLSPQQALANAPQRDGDFFKVPKVIGDS
jgi:aspartyl-tRNA(Asn)/glutamyl-tRNA(Gln) amidotransferase subunit C